MEQPSRLTELLARMWIECDPNRGGTSADEIMPAQLYSGGVGVNALGAVMTATPNPLAGKPGWHWFIPRAEATIAYLAKHGLEIRGDRKVMTMMELKVGDIVKLKTGGPEMTVNRVGPCGKHDHIDYIPAGEVQAAWFSPAVVRSGWNGAFSDVFGADALEKVDQCAADLLDPPLGRDGEVKETAPAEKEEAA